MISVMEVIVDPDMIAPNPFTVLRSTGKFVLGGFESVVTPIPMFGPVQQASDKEIAMLPEADRIGEMRSFWSTQPFYVTRGYAAVPGAYGEEPTGSGLAWTLSATPPPGITVYTNGLLSRNYTLSGNVITFKSTPATPIYVTWTTTVDVAVSASDIVVYDEDKYRVMRVYRDPGSGYWKAIGTRMAAS